MLHSEKLGIAAHLHVLLRRKSGRVTDVEWMASNAEYAHEIIRFTRIQAKEGGHTDLDEWASKLEAAMLQREPKRGFGSAATANAPPTEFAPPDAMSARYVRGIR